MAGELDNRTPGKVIGWMRFIRNGKPPLRVTFDLVGDFHEDIRGRVIKLANPNSSDEYLDEGKTYMEGFSRVQRWSEFATGETTLALHRASQQNPAGGVELGFAVPNIQEFHQEMNAKRVQFSMPPTNQDYGAFLRSSWTPKEDIAASPDSKLC